MSAFGWWPHAWSHPPGTICPVPSRPFLPARVAQVPSGASATTRPRLTDGERRLLEEIEAVLTEARAYDLAQALAGHKANDRYKVLVARYGIHSRYAGTICVDNNALVKTRRENLVQERQSLSRAVGTLTRRLAAHPKASCPCRAPSRRNKKPKTDGCDDCQAGYANADEAAMKRRRLDILTARLAEVDRRLKERDYPVVLGGRRLANTRHHLGEPGAPLDLAAWRQQWEASRAYLACCGNKGTPGGNPCLSVGLAQAGGWCLTVSVPRPVQRKLGAPDHVTLSAPLSLGHCPEVTSRVAGRLATKVAIELHDKGLAKTNKGPGKTRKAVLRSDP